jgi:hypothetical protein
MAFAAIVVYSWFQFPALEKSSQSKYSVYQFTDKIDNTSELPLRSSFEEISEIEETFTSSDHLSSEFNFSSICKVQFVQKQFATSNFGFPTKRYLRLLQLLI